MFPPTWRVKQPHARQHVPDGVLSASGVAVVQDLAVLLGDREARVVILVRRAVTGIAGAGLLAAKGFGDRLGVIHVTWPWSAGRSRTGRATGLVAHLEGAALGR